MKHIGNLLIFLRSQGKIEHIQFVVIQGNTFWTDLDLFKKTKQIPFAKDEDMVPSNAR